jgi:hypothetical protein
MPVIDNNGYLAAPIAITNRHSSTVTAGDWTVSIEQSLNADGSTNYAISFNGINGALLTLTQTNSTAGMEGIIFTDGTNTWSSLDGELITNLNASVAFSSGTIPPARLPTDTTNTSIVVGTNNVKTIITSNSITTGSVNATNFVGSGYGLSNVPGTTISVDPTITSTPSTNTNGTKNYALHANIINGVEGQFFLTTQTNLILDFTSIQSYQIFSTYINTNTVTLSLTNIITPTNGFQNLYITIRNLSPSNLIYSLPTGISWVAQASTTPIPTNILSGQVQLIQFLCTPTIGTNKGIIGFINN